MNRPDAWNPGHYQQFTEERNLPFFDLLSLIQPTQNMQIVDLGCGTGHLTKLLHEALKPKSTLGVDSSAAMLEDALKLEQAKLRFRLQKIEEFAPDGHYDLIFSNAALQWLPGHPQLFEKLSHYLAADGQLAIQVPSNFDYPTHTIARKLATEAPFNEWVPEGGGPAVLSLEEYATLLHRLGFKKQHARMQVYPHVLESTDSAVQWVRGTLLTYYQALLPAEVYIQFLQRYEYAVKTHFGDVRPFFMPFKRILIWAQRSLKI